MTSYNRFEHIVAMPEGGKTHLARALVVEDLNAGGWVIVHDPNEEYTDLLPYFTDAASWERYMVAAVEKLEPVCRGAAIGGEPADVIAMVMKLGDRWNNAHNVKLRFLLVIDESVMVGSSGRSWIGAREAELFKRRRHLGIGILWLNQDLDLDRTFYKLATDARIFRLGNPEGLERVEKSFNLPRGSLRRVVPRLPDYDHVHIRNGKGFL